MSDLREPLDDLLATIPAHVVPDARAAWAAGARRRARRRVGTAVTVVAAVVLLVGLGTVVVPRSSLVQPAAPTGSGAGGHPVRIDYPYWSRDLPDDVGRLAGVLERVDESGTADEPLGWYGVTESGRLWEVPRADPGYQPGLSPDGRLLAYLDTDSGQSFEVLHLAGGSVETVSIVGAESNVNAGNRGGSFRMQPQTPVFWSPDSRRLLVEGSPPGRGRSRAVVVQSDGRMGSAVTPPGRALAAGWVDDDSIGWLRLQQRGRRTAGAEVVVTDARGVVERRVALDIPSGRTYFGQWTGSVSTDGTTIALVSEEPEGEVTTYSLATGARTQVQGAGQFMACPLSWAGDEVRLPMVGDGGAVLVRASGEPVVVGDPRLGARCSQWAGSALSGEAHLGVGGTLFGTSDGWVSWHWREIALAGLATAALGIVLLWLRRRLSG